MGLLSAFRQGFKGGIHPHYSKITSRFKIEKAKIPSKVILPLSQHIGVPCSPIVKVGDIVKAGQEIANSDAFVSAPIHASISGTIKAIEDFPHPVSGEMTRSIIIESDGKDEKIETKSRDWKSMSPEDIKRYIRDAGVVGLGGAAFPTHVKLSPPEDKHIDTIMINGAECEPYITADHRLMLEKPDQLIEGVRILQKVLNVKTAYIGIEDNKMDAIRLLKKKLKDQNEHSIHVKTVPAKYPQGAEKTLIYAILKKKVPAGGLPMDIGVEVQNVGTTIAIYEAVAHSKPLYEKVMTITGKVNTPKNLMVRMGTMITDLIEQVDGYNGTPKKLINGGPMMGFALPTDELPVVKGTSSLVIFNQNDIHERVPIECIRCGKCLEVCPMHLNPALIAKYAEKDRIEQSKEMCAMDCFECGACSFICPSQIPLVHWIRYAKAQIKKEASVKK
ncbi:electron transport complex subunit RsxC [Candidatus Woesearchaeota archaeon]|nr:electron transport complex subunit RsxC [Candidatus Woesearchaeota archaeon]